MPHGIPPVAKLETEKESEFVRYDGEISLPEL